MRYFRLERTAPAAFLALLCASTAWSAANYFENFDGLTFPPTNVYGPAELAGRGWIFRNQSNPVGIRGYFPGFTGGFWPNPQSSAGYLGIDENSTDMFGGTTSVWAILPAIGGQASGDAVTLWVFRAGSLSTRIEIRYSPSGGTGTGSGVNGVGDFTQLLAAIDPVPGTGWTRFAATLPGSGRIALRFQTNVEPFSGGAYTAIDSLSVGAPPPPPCNLPPIPNPGQTVTWTTAGSPFRVCENISIPATGTVEVQPGVRVDFDANMQLFIAGTLRLLGTSTQPIEFHAPAVFPPMIEVNGGVLDGSWGEFDGQLRVNSAATVDVKNCEFAGNGLILAQELQAVAPLIHLTDCVFTASQVSLSDALVVLEGNTFIDTSPLILRGYADLKRTNTVIGGTFEISREDFNQPMPVNGIEASGSSGAGLSLNGGEFHLGTANVLQGNDYPLLLGGGLTPDSFVPSTGNTHNAIDVGNGGFGSERGGRWPNLGLHYHLTQPSTSLPGGHLTIDPGVVVEAANPFAEMRFRSSRYGTLRGRPNQPIIFRGLDGQSWSGLTFHTNSTAGPHLEHCVVQDADFGVISSDNWLYVDRCLLTGNQIGANTNTYGEITFGKSRFVGNAVGASLSDLGSLFLNHATNPNSFEGNAAGVDAFEFGSSADARHCWWGDATGPAAPGNPAGQGDAITGPGAAGISYAPFLTNPPDASNEPPLVRMMQPGLLRLYATPDYNHADYLLDRGAKYILRWGVQSDDAIVSQRIDFSPDGHFPSRYSVLVDDIPGDARSHEITLPVNPGFAASNQPQFLRIVSIDAAGQEGFDAVPILVPSGRLTGNVSITEDLSGQTFYAGQMLPDIQFTGSVSDFPTYTPVIVLESDGGAIGGIAFSGVGSFFQALPHISTDRARAAVRVNNNGNDVLWFFASGYFSIRHDPRLGFVPPTVSLLSPSTGQSYHGGMTVPVKWNATATEGLRSFDVQGSYDAGATWHPIVRDLPADATEFGWKLPPSSGIADVRIRVIVRDARFQNSSATSGAFAITAGAGFPAGDMNCDGTINPFDIQGFIIALNSAADYAAAYPDCDRNNADVNGTVNAFDIQSFIEALTQP